MTNRNISVKKAIKRGHLILSVPIFLLIIGSFILPAFLLDKEAFTGYIFLMLILICFFSIWLYIGYFSLKWKVWAFDRVSQVHLLRKRANESGLMLNDGNWILKYTLNSKSDRDKWTQLQKKFLIDDVYENDNSVPESTTLKNSTKKHLSEIIVWLICSIVGLFLLISKSYLIGALCTIPGIYYLIKHSKFLTDKKIKLKLKISDKGIEFNSKKYNWSDIESDNIMNEGSHKNRRYIFRFSTFQKQNFDIEITHLNIGYEEFEYRLNIYKKRNNYRQHGV